MYEEPKPGEPANPFPYIEVDKDDEMPKVLFIQQYKHTGEFEVDPNFGSVAIVDQLMHKFVDLDHLKEVLDPDTHDVVRVALGMKPLQEAQKDGKKVLSKVKKSAAKHRKELQTNDDARAERAFVLGEELRQKAQAFLDQNKQNDSEEEN